MPKYTPPKQKSKSVDAKKPRVGRPPKPRDKNGNILNEDQLFKYDCVCCGHEYDTPKRNFLTTRSPLFRAWDGYVPICRDCIAEYYTNHVLPSFDGDEARSMQFICGLFDWYFDEDMFQLALKYSQTYEAKNGQYMPTVIQYGTRINLKNWSRRGATFLERCKEKWQEMRSTPEGVSRDDLLHVERDTVDEEDISLFGPGYMPDEYKYMRREFNDWKERYSCETKAQEELFKNIVIAQVNVRRAQEQGEQKRTNEAVKSLNELMASAKVQPKQKTETALVDQNTFGTLIQKWENEEPIPEPADEFKDVDGIKKYISTWFLGHLSKMFGLDNDNAREYEEEMAKYTVEPPRYHGDEDDGQESIVGQKLKAMRGKNLNADDSEDGEAT